ncbi:hypothetical protein HaLaN_28974, partial [Haematococcus lacustris]
MAAGAVLLARPARFACQKQGVPWPGLEAGGPRRRDKNGVNRCNTGITIKQQDCHAHPHHINGCAIGGSLTQACTTEDNAQVEWQ